MLKGYYQDAHTELLLRGYDIADSLSFYVTSTKGTLEIDKGYFEDFKAFNSKVGDGGEYLNPTPWEDVYISIGPTTMRLAERHFGNLKNQPERQFWSRAAGIIRGMKKMCVKSNRADFYDIQDGSTFSTTSEVEYIIPDKGSITLLNSEIVSLQYAHDGVVLSLAWDPSSRSEQLSAGFNAKYHSVKLALGDFTVEADSWESDALFNSEDMEFYTIEEIIARNPHKNYDWVLKGTKYKVVKPHEVAEICKIIWEHDGIIAFDTETTGLNITFKSLVGEGDTAVGFVFSIREGEGWYFPLAHKKFANIGEPGEIDFLIEKFFKPILEEKELVCHNASFDWKVAWLFRINANIVHDTYALFKLTMWNTDRAMSLGLKALAEKLLGRDSLELKDFVKGSDSFNESNFGDFEEESAKYYAIPDTDNTFALLEYAKKKNLLAVYGAERVYEIEVLFSRVIGYQEFYGHGVKIADTSVLEEEVLKNIEESYAEMVKIVGKDFNPASTKELPEIMFKQLGMEVQGLTDTGKPSTSKENLAKLNALTDEEGNPKHPFIPHLMKHKQNTQLVSNFLKQLDKLATEDGFMFSGVQQYLETGRVSVNKPNYQSYNDTIKKYITPRNGYYMMDTDYSSVEYRILASIAGQEVLVNSFVDPEMDYHMYQASRLFNVPYELVSKALRNQSKGLNFGIPYGMSDFSLGGHIYGERNKANQIKATKLRKKYFEGQEKIEQFFVDAKKNAWRDKWADTYFGRRRYFDTRKVDRRSIERQAGNHRIQGTAADIFKKAMGRLFLDLVKRDWLGKVLIVTFVHDETVLEVHKSIDPAVMMGVLRENLSLKIEGWAPLYIGVGYGRNWYEAKSTEIPVQVQDQIIADHGETGLDWWSGDVDELVQWEIHKINDFKVGRVLDTLKDTSTWGKVINPAVNGYAHEIIDNILKGVNIHDVVSKDIKSVSNPVENILEFAKAFGVLPLALEADYQMPQVVVQSDSPEVTEDMVSFDEVTPLEFHLNQVKMFGTSRDMDQDLFYVHFRNVTELDNNLMRQVVDICHTYPGEPATDGSTGSQLSIVAVSAANGKVGPTNMTASIKGCVMISKLYTSVAAMV